MSSRGFPWKWRTFEYWVARYPPLNGGELKVLYGLLLHRNPIDGRCDPSISTNAGATSIGERSVRSAISSLSHRGAIQAFRGGKGRRNRYEIPTPGSLDGEGTKRKTTSTSEEGAFRKPRRSASSKKEPKEKEKARSVRQGEEMLKLPRRSRGEQIEKAILGTLKDRGLGLEELIDVEAGAMNSIYESYSEGSISKREAVETALELVSRGQDAP